MIKQELIKECNICLAEDEEIFIVLNNLINYMKKKKQNKNKELLNISESLYTQKYQGSFQKLLRFIFAEKIIDEKAESCPHEILKKYVQMKTKFTRRQIDIHSESIYQFQAKRNFQLEVLNSQIKCFTKTILNEVLNKNQSVPSAQNLIQSNQIPIKKEAPSIQNLLLPPLTMSQQQYNGFYYVVPMSQINLQPVFYRQNPF